jgi:hypothetical protein
MRVVTAAFAIVTIFALSASAQEAAREQCCKQVGGIWRAGRSRGYQAHNFCQGMGGQGGTIANAFYKCVASGGAKTTKKK